MGNWSRTCFRLIKSLRSADRFGMNSHEVKILVRKLVLDWRERHRLLPRQINMGPCLQFARELTARLPSSKIIWNTEFDHAYVRFQGRLYDAEVPCGVLRWEKLPAIKRQVC